MAGESVKGCRCAGCEGERLRYAAPKLRDALAGLLEALSEQGGRCGDVPEIDEAVEKGYRALSPLYIEVD